MARGSGGARSVRRELKDGGRRAVSEAGAIKLWDKRRHRKTRRIFAATGAFVNRFVTPLALAAIGRDCDKSMSA